MAEKLNALGLIQGTGIKARDLDTVRPFLCLCQLPGRLEPIPCIRAAAERLVEADRHLRGNP